MRFESIEFKNVFAYGENVNKIEYSSDGKLILLKGQSGSGKSAILALPILVLYGKLNKINKAGIANRVNKHGWVRGVIVKGQHKYTIEREFSPNSVKVWKDDVEIEFATAPQAENYIETEIQEIPINTFTNMITISMKKFKSFLTMSPAERKQVVDEVFDVSIVNYIGEQIKKDAKEIGNSINGDKSTMFSLSQTLSNANAELIKIQEKNATPDALEKIQSNNALIAEYNNRMTEYGNKMNEVAKLQQQNSIDYNSKQQDVYKIQNHISTLKQKIELFNNDKCPMCATPFTTDAYSNIKVQLADMYNQKMNDFNVVRNELNAILEKSNKLNDAYNKLSDAINQCRITINNIQHENTLINEKMKASAEYTAVQNIIDKTSAQIAEIKKLIDDKEVEFQNLKVLQMMYSIDGVTKLIINNYLPVLNDDIAENLLLLNFPYTLAFDDKFNPHIKDMGTEVQVETLSDGEQTRVDFVVLCALFKLLKRKYPSINILTIDESISTLDTVNSGAVLSFLCDFALENDLNCFIVSHTDLFIDNFNEMIEVEKVNGFSHITKTDLI